VAHRLLPDRADGVAAAVVAAAGVRHSVMGRGNTVLAPLGIALSW